MAPTGVYGDFPPRDPTPSEYFADVVASFSDRGSTLGSFFGSGLKFCSTCDTREPKVK